MSGFRQLRAEVDAAELAPRRVVTLEPSAWVDTWAPKPRGRVDVGLKLLSSQECAQIASRCARQAFDLHPHPEDIAGRVRAHNRAMVVLVAAWGTCHPKSLKRPIPMLDFAEKNMPLALREEAIRYLFDEWVRFSKSEDPTLLPADDGDVQELAQRLQAGELDRLDPARALEARKDLTWLLGSLRALRDAEDA